MSAFYLACFSLYIWHVILYGTSSYLQPTIFQNFKLIYRIFNALLFHTTVSHRSSKNSRSTSSQRIAAHCELGTPWYLLTRTPGGPWSPLWEPVLCPGAQELRTVILKLFHDPQIDMDLSADPSSENMYKICVVKMFKKYSKHFISLLCFPIAHLKQCCVSPQSSRGTGDSPLQAKMTAASTHVLQFSHHSVQPALWVSLSYLCFILTY